MKSELLAENGWIYRQYDGSVLAFSIRNKELAFFETLQEFESIKNEIMYDTAILPTPDFLAKPHFAAITLTTQCNMNCPYCYVQPVSGYGKMTDELARSAVNALAKLTDEELVIFAWGGEPTLNPDALIAMIEEALKYSRIKILLITNGVVEEKLLDRLLSYRNLVFQISFDGRSNESRQKTLIGNEDSLSHMLTSFETVCRVSKRVSLRSTITKQNLDDIRNTLIDTALPHTNRVMLEHLHTSNGRSVNLKYLEPGVDEYADLVTNIVPRAEKAGIHVKVLPLDQIREGGPNDNMTFLNVLTDGSVVVSNAVIHNTHKDFETLKIGSLENGRFIFDQTRNKLLSERYMRHFRHECKSCPVAPLCRGSVQRYLFITNDHLYGWDDKRCQYYRAVISRWMDEMYSSVKHFLDEKQLGSGYIRLLPPEGKKHYPVFVMNGGFRLSHMSF